MHVVASPKVEEENQEEEDMEEGASSGIWIGGKLIRAEKKECSVEKQESNQDSVVRDFQQEEQFLSGATGCSKMEDISAAVVLEKSGSALLNSAAKKQPPRDEPGTTTRSDQGRDEEEANPMR